jgi:hypothetical protein
MTIFRNCAIVALALTAVGVKADPRKVQVSFERGAAETTVKGSLKGPGGVSYVFRAKTGETVEISLKSDQPRLGFILTAPQAHELTYQADIFRGVAPLDGDYKVTLHFLRSEANRNPTAAYALKISHAMVEPPADPQ